jgi:hypothetical protein
MALLMSIGVSSVQAQCTTVNLNLFDSWGDSWNGNSLTIDGTDYTISDPSGATASFTICIDLDVCNDVTYNATGSYTYENSWSIEDISGNTLASGADNSGVVGGPYTLNLYDSWGDSWNGNSLTVAGIDYTISDPAGATASFPFLCADGTVCNDVTYNATGSYTYENAWEILDASGSIVVSGNDNSDEFGTCSACSEPSAFVVNSSSLTTTTAEFSWSPGAVETEWDFELVLAGTAPTGVSTHDVVTANPWTIGTVTPLSPATSYDIYIRASCGGLGTSPWSTSPVTFTTEGTCGFF